MIFMKLIVPIEHRFDKTPDGTVWTETIFPYDFWTRYLEVFDHVNVIARVRLIPEPVDGSQKASGNGVSFTGLPYYVGPWQYLFHSRQVNKIIKGAINSESAVIMRVTSQIACCIYPFLKKSGHPFGLEVVGDPYDTFAPGSIKTPLRPFYRWWFTKQLQNQCLEANAVAYVTEKALQLRYPTKSGTFSTNYSSIVLNDNDYIQNPRTSDINKSSFTVISVGSLEHLYKAPDILIEAIARCISSGMEISLILVGDGRYRDELEARTATIGLREKVKFLGKITGGELIKRHLDQADLFVLPSRQEGLPRAMLEAMARGLPCIGSTVGGIPELLDDNDLIPPGDVIALSDKIQSVLSDHRRMSLMSVRNLEKAKDYHESILKLRRVAFYNFIKDTTEDCFRIK